MYIQFHITGNERSLNGNVISSQTHVDHYGLQQPEHDQAFHANFPNPIQW